MLRILLVYVIFAMQLFSLQVFFSKTNLSPGDFILVTLVMEKNDSFIKAYENKKRRIIYRNKERLSKKIYYFFSGYDIQFFPKKVTFKFVTAAGTYKKTFTIKKKPIKKGKVVIAAAKKKLLNDKGLHKRENAFFHRFFKIESKKQYWSGVWVPPIKEPRVTSTYGKVRTYNNGKNSYHRGVDFGHPEGTPVGAVNHGIVVYAGKKAVRGNVIVIDHGCGIYTEYWHLSRIRVRAGQRVRKKQVIGYVGDTGQSSAPHLHFGLRIHGTPVNGLDIISLPKQYVMGEIKEN
jgi:murein DD-endopeptidase MepM/ murein hydrolase activator NlpD